MKAVAPTAPPADALATARRRAGPIVRLRRLHGKADEQRRGLAAVESDEQGAIAADPVVSGERAAVALHHVDVVDASFLREAERAIATLIGEGFSERDDDGFR